jgi:hypothetical protein
MKKVFFILSFVIFATVVFSQDFITLVVHCAMKIYLCLI